MTPTPDIPAIEAQILKLLEERGGGMLLTELVAAMHKAGRDPALVRRALDSLMSSDRIRVSPEWEAALAPA